MAHLHAFTAKDPGVRVETSVAGNSPLKSAKLNGSVGQPDFQMFSWRIRRRAFMASGFEESRV